MSKTPLLKVSNISKSYGASKTRVLNEVSFELHKGESLAILGYSGEGKTTLLNLIAGLLDADEGEIWLHEDKILGPSDKLVPGHEDIRLVFQHYGLDPNLSVEQNLMHRMLGFKPEVKKKRTQKLLKWCLLDHLADKRVELLSGGEKQRLALARAVADFPSLLLLDEPFSSIDLPLRIRFKQGLRNMAVSDGFAMIMVTHDYQDAFYLADKILIIKDGKIIRTGSPEEIYLDPQVEDVALLLGARNILKTKNNSQKIWIKEELIQLKARGKGWQGIIVGKIFLGDFFEYIVENEREEHLIVRSKDRDYAIGRKVSLEWREEATAILN